MLAPGAKGWISKYFDMVEKGELWVSIRNYDSLSLEKHLHLTFSRCGIVFGLATRAIFGHKLDTKTWTNEERLKVLLMEALLFVHLKNGGKLDKDEVISELLEFYEGHTGPSVKKGFSIFKKDDTAEARMEKILAERVDIPMNILENKWWVNSLTNAFVYLDVILFQEFAADKESNSISRYSLYAKNALLGITLSAYADGVIDNREKDLFNLFLASAKLNEQHREEAESKFKEGGNFMDFDPFVRKNWLFTRFLLDLSLLMFYSKMVREEKELKFVHNLCSYLSIPENELEETVMFIEDFIIANKNQVDFLSDAPSYEKVYGSFSKRWGRILIRNKDKVAVELQESKELVVLMKKSMSENLSPEEKEKVKAQMKDLLKSLPAVAVFMIPGGTILMPMMMKLIPDMLPSAFRDNEIED